MGERLVSENITSGMQDCFGPQVGIYGGGIRLLLGAKAARAEGKLYGNPIQNISGWNITPRVSWQTSSWPLITRKF